MKNRKLLVSLLFAIFAFIACEKFENVESSSNSTAEFNPNIVYGTMNDQDNNIYKTVTIGSQTWMAENLHTTKYNDGTSIPIITDANKWRDLTVGAYCIYNNTTNTDTIDTYGFLYNWQAINTTKLAPEGWHIPTNDDWTLLITYLGGDIAGYKLKEVGTLHWKNPNTGVTNETGFTALPGGQRYYFGEFQEMGVRGYWWSSYSKKSRCCWRLAS